MLYCGENYQAKFKITIFCWGSVIIAHWRESGSVATNRSYVLLRDMFLKSENNHREMIYVRGDATV